MVADALANATRAAHDVGLAAWLGGSMFGKFALSPSLEKVSSHTERGSLNAAAWNGYNLINALGLGAAAAGWGAARFTEAKPDKLSGRERTLAQAKDGLMGAAVLTGIASAVQGGRLATQAPDGAVAVQTSTTPALDTPPTAAKIQRTLGVLGNLNIATGVALVAVNAILAQTSHSRPAAGRTLLRNSLPIGGPSPLWIASAGATLAAAVDEARRRLG